MEPRRDQQQAIRALRDDFGDDAVDDRGPVPGRVHRSRALRRADDRRRGRQRRDARALRERIARAQAEAGVDMVGPSGMMDGQVGRSALRSTGRGRRTSRSWPTAAKFASALYGPFREAAEGAPTVRRPDRLPAGPGQRRRGAARDLDRPRAEGADIVMVKPGAALPRRRARRRGPSRCADRRVSRERRVRDGEGGFGQRLARRASCGARSCSRRCAARAADLILTYHAADAATWLTSS